MSNEELRWDDLASVRAAIAQGLNRAVLKSLNTNIASVRATLADLAPEELARVLADTSGLGVQRDRALRYAKHYEPVAYKHTGVYVNLAFLYLELGQLADAVTMLRRGILASDPNIQAQWLRNAELAKPRETPGFEELPGLRAEYPVPLRRLKIALEFKRDEDVIALARRVDLEAVYGRFEARVAAAYSLDARADEIFPAFWKRDPRGGVESCPIIIFGSDGSISVYARDLAGFFALLACGLSFAAVENVGFRPTADGRRRRRTFWVPPARARASVRSSSPCAPPAKAVTR
jgi:tetratricopeptide (TPR) repeat protein